MEVMARFRSRMAMMPINRIKHVVDTSATLAAGVPLISSIAIAGDTPTQGVTNSVQTGAKINGIYFKIEVASNEAIDVGAIPNVYLIIGKNPGGNLVMPNANAVGSNDNKRFIFHQEMVMIENKGQGSNGRTLFNGVVVIPKGVRRMGPNDVIFTSVLSPALNIAICSQSHYKEFR